VETGKRDVFHRDMLWAVSVLSFTFLAVALIPFIGPIVVIMTPLPILYCCLRLGRKDGLMALGVSLFAVSGILGLLGLRPSLSAMFGIGFAGVMLAEVLKRRYSLEKTIAVSSLALFIFGIGLLTFHAQQKGAAPLEFLEILVARMVNENIRLYEMMNFPTDQILLLRENIPQITRFFTGIFPALTLSGAIVTVWLNLLVGRRFLQRYFPGFPDFGDLASWKAPEKLVWLLIAAGGMVLAASDLLYVIGMNVLIVCSLIYLGQGLAIAGFLFRQKKVPLVFRAIFYTLLLVQQYLLIVVIAFGLFDIWIDFRKRIGTVRDADA